MIFSGSQCVASRGQTQTRRVAFEALNTNGTVAPILKRQLFCRSANADPFTHISDAELDFFDSGASHLSQTVTQPECAKNPYGHRSSAH